MIPLVTSPGDGEITVVADETIAETDPLLAKLLAAATAGVEPAGPANKRQPIRIKSEPIARKILVAMHLSADVPELHPARPPPGRDRDGRNAEDWVN